MDERRSKYRDRPRSHCAVDMQDAVSVIEGRWKMMILAHLFGETVRYGGAYVLVCKACNGLGPMLTRLCERPVNEETIRQDAAE